MDSAQRGPYKNERGPMFPTAARASEVRKYFIIWYSDLTCLFWICLLNDNLINLLKFIGGELHSVLLYDK